MFDNQLAAKMYDMNGAILYSETLGNPTLENV